MNAPFAAPAVQTLWQDAPRFDARHFRAALGHYPTGVTVVTTRTGDGRHVGMTANSFASLSLDPPLILWSVGRQAPSRADFEASTHFVVNLLADDQCAVSRRFATPADDKFAGVAHREGPHGLRLLDDCNAHFVCRKVAQYDGGDHVIFIGGVEHYEAFGRAPLVFHSGGYGVVAPHPSSG